jgi:hypothetical protein
MNANRSKIREVARVWAQRILSGGGMRSIGQALADLLVGGPKI